MDSNEQIRHSRQQYAAIIQEYIHHELLPALNFRGDVSLTPAYDGIRSLVYFLEGPEFERRILRAEEMQHRFRRRIRGHKLLLQHGFNVPQIVYQDMSPAVKKKYGFFFMVETCLAGVQFNRAQNPVAAASNLGSTLARMHEITSWGYGWPGELRWQGRLLAGLQLRRQAQSHLAIYRQHNIIDISLNYRLVLFTAVQHLFKSIHKIPALNPAMVQKCLLANFIPALVFHIRRPSQKIQGLKKRKALVQFRQLLFGCLPSISLKEGCRRIFIIAGQPETNLGKIPAGEGIANTCQIKDRNPVSIHQQVGEC